MSSRVTEIMKSDMEILHNQRFRILKVHGDGGCLDVCVCFNDIEDNLHAIHRDQKPSMSTGRSLLDVTGIVGPKFVPRSLYNSRFSGTSDVIHDPWK